MTTVEGLSVWIPALPQRILSSNAGGRSRRDPWSVSVAKQALGLAAAAELVGDLPHWTRAQAYVALFVARKRPKLEDCPRCMELAARGDYPTWALPADPTKPVPCCEYRPTDVGNIGGEVLKPLLDALTKAGVIPDDHRRHLRPVTLDIQEVEDVAHEGILIRVLPMDVSDGAGRNE